MKKIIYVAGYGRSGSTLLDVILDNCANVVGVGELTYLFDEYQHNNDQLLPFWKTLVERTQQALNLSVQDMEKVTLNVQNSIKESTPTEKEVYKSIWSSIFNQIFDSYPQQYVLDSSKSSRIAFKRPILLKEMGYEVKVLHIVRDPRAVMFSTSKGSNKKLEKKEKAASMLGGGYRGLLSWIYVNTMALKYYKIFNKDTIMMVRYEDMVEQPLETIARLTEFLGVQRPDYEILSDGKLEFLSEGIGVSGNRMRRASSKIVLKKDDSWKEKLPLFKKIIASVLAFPLMKRFGYSF